MPGKYQPLADYLAAQASTAITLTFTEIEALLAQNVVEGWDRLPASAYDRSWWVAPATWQGRAWRGVGWQATEIDGPQQAVRFERIGPPDSTP